MSEKTSRQRKNFRLRIYKNPASKSYRVDLAVPCAPGGTRHTHGYVGTVFRKATGDTACFEGRLTALDSDDLARDNDLSGRLGLEAGVAVLRLTELPDQGRRQRKRKLSAEFLVSSGRYGIEARHGDGDAIIMGTTIEIVARQPSVSGPQATTTASARQRKRPAREPK